MRNTPCEIGIPPSARQRESCIHEGAWPFGPRVIRERRPRLSACPISLLTYAPRRVWPGVRREGLPRPSGGAGLDRYASRLRHRRWRFHRPLPFALLGTHDLVTTKERRRHLRSAALCLRGLRRWFPSIVGAFLIPGAVRGAQQCGEECYRCGVFDPLG